jgi:hypothetical protein
MKRQHHYLHPSDAEDDPAVRLIVERSDETYGIVNIYEAKMTSAAPSAQELEAFGRLIVTPEAARWLRDVLAGMDLEDTRFYRGKGPCPVCRATDGNPCDGYQHRLETLGGR